MTDEAAATQGPVLLSARAGTAGVIVCERTGRWAVALRRDLADAPWRVEETRSVTACWEALAEAPASVLVVELTTANVGELLQRMPWLGRDFPWALVALVADRRLAGYECLMEEAGAIHFVCSPRQLRPIAQLAKRHLAGVSHSPQGLADRIWASLPWQRRASREE